MMHSQYNNMRGDEIEFDLDAAVGVAVGTSKARKGWSATLVYVPATMAFVELRSSPQNWRGDSKDEAEEVDESYIYSTFGMIEEDLRKIRSSPKKWKLKQVENGLWR